jgi:hypothetical protein
VSVARIDDRATRLRKDVHPAAVAVKGWATLRSDPIAILFQAES